MSTTKSNAELLAALDAAFKDITEVDTLGLSVLQTEKFDAFIREMQFRTRLLPEARFMEMQAKQRDIDRIAFVGRIIRSGKQDNGAHRSLGQSQWAQPGTATNRLITNELIAIASLRDDTLRENIERGGLEGTLLQLFGQAAGRDFEEYAIFGDKEIPFSQDDVLSRTDGWLRKCANKLYGRSWDNGAVAGDFNPEKAFDPADPMDLPFPENMFQEMLLALPKQYFEDPGDFRFYVPWEVEDAYRTVLKARQTALGDAAQTDAAGLRYKGVPVVQVPLFARASTVDLEEETEVTRDRIEGRPALLTVPNNLVWGVFHEMTIEPEREAKERRTDYVITFEGDAHYEDENAAVVALIDKAEP